ncbi:DUF3040 domain-containing protein, partial [Streptomyces flaveus]|uniref:DUF3040 domain-containing protein n=1 Tax=Streptomyces flaveus TaxID=66370 RepID=UPI001670CA05
MATGRLPDREQRILDEMEVDLRRDRRLRRRLRTLQIKRRLNPARAADYQPRVPTVVLLLSVSVVLMVAGIRTSEPVVIWAFAVLWPLTLFGGFRLLCRWTEP